MIPVKLLLSFCSLLLGLACTSIEDKSRLPYVKQLDHVLYIHHEILGPHPINEPMRKYVSKMPFKSETRLLELGTGSGVLSLIAAHSGCEKVVATDINIHAVTTTKKNAEDLGLSSKIEVRLVSPENPGAYARIRPEEKFHYIISNPPWFNRKAVSLLDMAFADENFIFLDSIIKGARNHLHEEGELILELGDPEAIQFAKERGRVQGFKFTTEFASENYEIIKFTLPDKI